MAATVFRFTAPIVGLVAQGARLWVRPDSGGALINSGGDLVALQSNDNGGVRYQAVVDDAAVGDVEVTIRVGESDSPILGPVRYLSVADDVGPYDPEESSLTQQGVRDAMKLDPSVGAPASNSVDQDLGDIEAKIDLLSGSSGPGARLLQWTVEDTSNNPVPDAQVWISTDNPYTTPNVIAGTLITDDAGLVEFLLDDDVVYYGWVDSDDFSFPTPAIQFRYSTANSRWEKWNGAAYEEWT